MLRQPQGGQQGGAAGEPTHLQAHAARALVVIKVLQGLEAAALLAEADLQARRGTQ